MSAPPASDNKIGIKKVGSTGLYVNELMFGCMTLGTSDKNSWGLPTANEEVSHQMLDEYAARGGFTFDTANVYADSEEVLGGWLSKQPRRDDMVISTKVRGRMSDNPNNVGLSRKHITASVEESLARLKTHYIDIYHVHSYDVETPLEETLRALDDLVRIGKVRYLAVSNFCGYQVQKALDLSRQLGLEKFVALQPQYSLVCRSTEWDLLRVSKEEGLGVFPWSPLAGGVLSGRLVRNASGAEKGSRMEWAEKAGWKATSFSTHSNDQTFKILDTAQAIAEKHQRTVPQVCLRWVMQNPVVTSPIIGAKKMDHLKDNLDAVSFQLTPEDMAALDAASQTPVPYPWSDGFNFKRDYF